MVDLRTSFSSSTDGEMFTTNTEREKNVRVQLVGTQDTAATNYYGFIDLSDTTNWPHDSAGRLDFSYLSLLIDKAAAARGSVSLGIITRIDGTNSDITWIASASFTQNDTASVEIIANFAPSQLKTDIVAGKLARVKTNNISLALTAINTGTPIAFGTGGATFVPAVGDAIIRISTTTGGNLVWGFSSFYHSHPSLGA